MCYFKSLFIGLTVLFVFSFSFSDESQNWHWSQYHQILEVLTAPGLNNNGYIFVRFYPPYNGGIDDSCVYFENNSLNSYQIYTAFMNNKNLRVCFRDDSSTGHIISFQGLKYATGGITVLANW